MMHFSDISVDVVWMTLIPFALKDSAKRLMYGLAVNSVASWDDFVKLLLKNIFWMPKLVG